jgi:hypothetical protein
METLNSAARAAGFAMAASDEPLNPRTAESQPEAWRPGDSVALETSAARKTGTIDWVKSLFGLFGRGAPA